MISFAIRRILSTIPIMAVVAVFIFSILHIAPGDPAVIIGGDSASVEDIERIRETLGLSEPLHIQFGIWCWNLLNGNLGHSIFFGRPVLDLIGQRIGPTFALTICTLIVTLPIAVPLGVLAAWKAGRWPDRLIMVISVIGFSVPSFVLGYLLIFSFSIGMNILPVQGYKSISDGLWPFLRHMLLPSITLGLFYAALVTRITRASVLEILNQDYIRTARAKGLSTWSILMTHALKNAAVPIMTVIGIGIGLLLSGVIITETVFAIPGIGRLIVDSILKRDYPVIQGITLMFSFGYVILNLLIDISYALFDPRIRY